MKLFWVDSKREVEISYDVFFQELLKSNKNNSYIKNENPYFVFLNLMRNFISGKKSVVLDCDFSDDEILKLDITNNDIKENQYFQPELSKRFKSYQDVFNYLDNKKGELTIDIYTSGTTGRPKKVTQTYHNLIRAIKVKDLFEKSIWGFAYNPTHFAGMQVFFQAFYNKNTLVYIFNKDFGDIALDFKNYKITNISCTPTYMKMLLPYIKEPLSQVVGLSFGGEKFDSKILRILNEKFPKAKIKNIYASTEAGSLLRAEEEYFVIPEKYKEVLKIEKDELLIHKELLGISKSFELEGVWYKTGDLVEFKDTRRFKFKSRKSEMINVGGYKVNPAEVEDVIKKVNGVKDVIVFGRNNSVMGQIVVANVILENEQNHKNVKVDIKNYVTEQLQDYKVPRLIKFVDSFELTRTGKIKK